MRKLLLSSVLVLGLCLSALGMSSDRVLEIQKALIRRGYSVQLTGRMDAKTANALKQLQKRNHWQSKVVPDSRALIVLGLGPKYKHLLNPDTAWVAYCQECR